ncbi:carbohydrate-binding family 9-like protein [Poriferisphaera sp. WC338]|uniref:carbohydrate-binding family 9-like protein n=1 Tax=Poriferisphaera sp. WC338 TaxID=3425129 RepID=UPI003D817A87
MSKLQVYEVHQAVVQPELLGDWNGPVWGGVLPANIDQYHKESSDHHPHVQAKMLYGDCGIYLHFRVQDQYVLAQKTEHQQMVCQDSCAEFFVQPIPCEVDGEGRYTNGYFNFELSCGGTLLLYYVTIPRQEQIPVTNQWLDEMKIYHSLPKVINPEMVEPTVWQVEYFVPYKLFEAYVGKLGSQKPGNGVTWRGNFYKCADHSSHPHWGMWSDVGEKLDFHQPDKFGEIRFV